MFLSQAQLKAEMEKCEFCEEKPCRDACPVDCSPADFIMAAQRGSDGDFQRAAAIIMGHNPLGGVCGAVCPETHCMAACVHKTFNASVDIPAVQATLIQKAKDLGRLPEFHLPQANGRRVAIVGGGPAGIGAAALLAQKGYEIDLYEREEQLGGMANVIPDFRLDKAILQSDLSWMLELGVIHLHMGEAIDNVISFSNDKYDACIVATGLDAALTLNIPGEAVAASWTMFLKDSKQSLKQKHVAIIGGGAVALDCALTARLRGAGQVDLICLENPAEMPLTAKERSWLLETEIGVLNRTRLNAIGGKKNDIELSLSRVTLPEGQAFHPTQIVDIAETEYSLKQYDQVVIAIGARSAMPKIENATVFYAGDSVNGPTTVVEAVAAGKNIAEEVHAFIQDKEKPAIEKNVKSTLVLAGRELIPVPLECTFFGRKINSPFLLSAAPPTDGYAQMKKAYDAGWSGGVMKTAFNNLAIHIPAEYMFVVNEKTYGNCDNVSGHTLDRVCAEIGKLVKEYPNRLTMASTGGPITGDDEADKVAWQSNTRKCEQAGAMGVEYSLSCPQGGDGTKGDIVSQDAELTAKVVDWVMEISDDSVPKLFKLTGAVTAIYPILKAIQEVLERYPNKKAGVTLANTFPALAFRDREGGTWDEGVVIGLSGEGVRDISNLTLANASKVGLTISGNGGPMDYKAAADFLALGVETVQFCTVALKYGVGIINELHSGLSYLLKDRGFVTVTDLIGCALPSPFTDFMDLSPEKKISAVNEELCEHCGNCQRCPYLAIELNEDRVPVTDAERCIGCSLCVEKCFSGALRMRERTVEEVAALQED
ncbi:FAD-dependent oxidoreductase [bacterium]|nr:FAD-dependent oxidoreductase [bacterium]